MYLKNQKEICGNLDGIRFTFKELGTNELGEHFIFMCDRGSILGYFVNNLIQIHCVFAFNFMKEMLIWLIKHYKTNEIEFVNVLMPILPSKLKGFVKLKRFDNYVGEMITLYKGKWIIN